MQSKRAIGLFAILLAIVCLFELSFTFIVAGIEKDARKYADGDLEKERAYLDSIANEPVYNIFLKKYTYKECKEKELNLGLDLKGGMNVTLEVSVPDVVYALSNYSKDPVFQQAFAAAKQRFKSGGDFINLFAQEVKKADPEARLASSNFFGHRELKDVINAKMTNEEVLEVIRQKVDASIDNSYIVVRNRIDRFGVAQPNIQRLDAAGRILVELPGVKDPDRVRKLLQGAAKLEFFPTYDNPTIYPYFEKVNARLREILGDVNTDEKNKDSASVAKATIDSSNISLAEKLAATGDSSALANDSTQKSIEQLRKENPLFAILQPYTTDRGSLAEGPIVGIVQAKDTAKVNNYLAMAPVRALLPADAKFIWGVKARDKGGVFFDLYAIQVPRDGKAPLTGEAITNASKEFGPLTGKPQISMNMNAEGAAKWKKLTGENVNRSIAIVLDDAVVSAPNVQQEIAGGSSQITGEFTIREAEDLANILNSGKMDAPARIVEEAVVGPSLGQEAINAGLISSLVGILLVLLFMIAYYRTAGLVANVALLANLFFLMGVMASLGAVLTLPGIAGIVLTIGMSVDANVLIYERIREEVANGKGLKMAIGDGYKKAYSAIIDSNLTTLLTGIILYIFGKGPIQGFATTLIIGILTSLFSALFITRLIFDWMLKKNYKITFSGSSGRSVFANANFKFVQNRKRYFGASIVIVLIGVAFMLVKGFSYGVDFNGGFSYVVRFENNVSSTAVRSQLAKDLGTNPDVKIFGSQNQLKITTDYLIESEDPKADSLVSGKIIEGLTLMDAGNKPEIVSSQKVGPTIAKDIKRSAVYAVVFSLLVLFLYIRIRFSKWYFGLAATVGLAYVVLFILSVFSIFSGILPFSLDIDQAFIAAILTVVGYAINDTVIIFDRIREYLGMHKAKSTDIGEMINSALNSTLSRTLVTSLTTLIVLVILFFFGGEVIRGFSFAMLMGIVVGTFTSLFVASPIVVDLAKRKAEQIVKEKATA